MLLADEDDARQVLPRAIDETPIEDDDSDEEAGYLMPEPDDDPDYGFSGEAEIFQKNGPNSGRAVSGGCGQTSGLSRPNELRSARQAKWRPTARTPCFFRGSSGSVQTAKINHRDKLARSISSPAFLLRVEVRPPHFWCPARFDG